MHFSASNTVMKERERERVSFMEWGLVFPLKPRSYSESDENLEIKSETAIFIKVEYQNK